MSWKPVEFSVIKKFIKEKIDEPSIVKGNVFSYLKLVQHGLSYSLTKAKIKRSYNPFDKPLFRTRLKYLISSLIRPAVFPRITFRSIVVLDSKRIEEVDGKMISVVFGKIIREIGREKITWVDSTGKLGEEANVYLPSDLIARGPLNDIEKRIWRDLHMVYSRLKKSGTFTHDELQYTGASFHVFFEAFRKYYRLFSGQNIKTVFLSTHYHQEGLIAACAILNIQTIEAQHGLIAAQDLYYAYEEHWKDAIKEALFPDRILVFGDYWRKILLAGSEFMPENIIVAGDYMHRKSTVENTSHTEEKIILVATQKTMGYMYIPYVVNLASRLKKMYSDWKIIVKIHPFEKDLKAYYDGLSFDNVQIIRNEKTIDELLPVVSIQISAYSTTLFEGLGTSAIGMVLLIEGPGIDYSRDLVNQGIAIGIGPEDDPVSIWNQMKKQSIVGFPRESVYSPFNPECLKKLV